MRPLLWVSYHALGILFICVRAVLSGSTSTSVKSPGLPFGTRLSQDATLVTETASASAPLTASQGPW